MTLDEKYERFAQLVFQGIPEHEAFLSVGYPKGSSYKANARRLSHHPKVKARVKELQSQAAACMVIDAAWLRGKVQRIAGFEFDLSRAKPSDVIAAQALLAKMLPGALVPQTLGLAGADGEGPVEFAWKDEQSPLTMRHAHSSDDSMPGPNDSPALLPTGEPEKQSLASTISSEEPFQVSWSDQDLPT